MFSFFRFPSPPRAQIPERGMWHRKFPRLNVPLAAESIMGLHQLGDAEKTIFLSDPIQQATICPAGIFKIGGGCGRLPGLGPIEIPITVGPVPAPVQNEQPITTPLIDPVAASAATPAAQSSSQTALNAAIGIGGVVAIIALLRGLTR